MVVDFIDQKDVYTNIFFNSPNYAMEVLLISERWEYAWRMCSMTCVYDTYTHTYNTYAHIHKKKNPKKPHSDVQWDDGIFSGNSR